MKKQKIKIKKIINYYRLIIHKANYHQIKIKIIQLLINKAISKLYKLIVLKTYIIKMKKKKKLIMNILYK